jgi:OOP family OmpA-OmpF porin
VENGKAMILSGTTQKSSVENQAIQNIFIARQNEEGVWAEVYNAGLDINTLGSERSPFMYLDGRTLYFSSNAHGSLGGLDVFKSVREGNSYNRFSKPVNLGKEINNLGDDFGFVIAIDGVTAYFATQGVGSTKMDIFTVKLPRDMEPEVKQKIVEIQVVNANPEQTIVIKDAEGRFMMEVKPDFEGKIAVPVPDSMFNLTIEAKGSVSNKLSIPVPVNLHERHDSSIVSVDMPVLVGIDGGTFTVPNLYFEKDKYFISQAGLQSIQSINNTLKNLEEFPDIEVAGFADPDGSDAYNLELSQNRANAVRRTMIEQGYPPEKITARGYGKTYDGKRELTDEEKALARRVEIRFR